MADMGKEQLTWNLFAHADAAPPRSSAIVAEDWPSGLPSPGMAVANLRLMSIMVPQDFSTRAVWRAGPVVFLMGLTLYSLHLKG